MSSALVILQNPNIASAIEQLREQTDVKYVPFVGIASTEHVDVEGEIVSQEGLDWSYFLEHGRIIDNHGREGKAVIGHPTKVELITLPDGTPATWIEGVLYEHEGTKDLLRAIRAAQAAGRPYGLSIEAMRPIKDGKRILRAEVVNVAVVPYAINTHTIMAVLKGLCTRKGLTFGEPIVQTITDGAALVPQSLEGNVATATLRDEKGGHMDELKAAVKKFLEDRTPEEIEALKAALAEHAADEEPHSETEKPVVEGAEEAEVEVEEEEKGITEVATGVTAEEVDVTEFLESLVLRIMQGLDDLKTWLDGVLKTINERHEQLAGQVSALINEQKGLRDYLERSPAAVKGVTFGVPSTPPTQPSVPKTLDANVVKGLLLAKARDTALPADVRHKAAWLACKMEAGAPAPSALELAELGIQL